MKKISFYIKMYALVLALVATACAKPGLPPFPTLDRWNVVDLTQPLTDNIPIWPGDPRFELTPWATYEKDQYFINRISIGEHFLRQPGARIGYYASNPITPSR